MVNDQTIFFGKTAAVVGSGPSLTREDCELLFSYEIPTIVVNSSWKMAPWAEILYAGDFTWWKNHLEEARKFKGELWTCNSQAARMYKINLHIAKGTAYNSGLRAAELADIFLAERILLVGFDLSLRNGVHWHGEHKKTRNPNERRCEMWVKQFENAKFRAEVINCTPQSALNRFKKMRLGEALESFMS